MAGRRTDTRERIRAVAMELFSEQGYDNTSLREIAERLGITKAALYYHFKTKEDIVADLSDEVRAGVGEILGWAAAQPPGKETGHEILARYGAVMHDVGLDIVRFMAENRPAFRKLEIGTALRYQFVEVAAAMTGPDADPLAVFHARQALLAISWSVTMTNDLELTDQQRRDAALAIARDIFDRV